MLLEGRIKYVIYNTSEGYRIQAIPLRRQKFGYRKGLYYKGRGLEREALKLVTGLEDITFIHNQGHIAGSVTKESAIKLAEMSLYDFYS